MGPMSDQQINATLFDEVQRLRAVNAQLRQFAESVAAPEGLLGSIAEHDGINGRRAYAMKLRNDALDALDARNARQVPDAVWEALQRMIEDGGTKGPASREDALVVARHRDRHLFMRAVPTDTAVAPATVPVFQAVIKTKKQMRSEIPSERWGWYVDVAGGQTLLLRDAVAADLARCTLKPAHSKDPADWLCEIFPGGALVAREAVKSIELVAHLRAVITQRPKA